MLILSRKQNESFLIEGKEGKIEIIVTEISGGQVRLGIHAPKSYKILRQELIQTMENNRQASAAAQPSSLLDIATLANHSREESPSKD